MCDLFSNESFIRSIKTLGTSKLKTHFIKRVKIGSVLCQLVNAYLKPEALKLISARSCKLSFINS
jgi:hypothetical protein